MTISSFNKAACKMIADDIEAALKTVAEKYGVTVEYGGGSFSPTDFKPKIAFKCVTASGVPASFATDALMLGVPKVTYGMKFSTYTGEYTLVGFNTRKHKYPVIGQTAAGKKFIFPVTVLLSQTP